MTLKERQAQKLAEFIHLGQLRRGGKPYITHPQRVVDYLKQQSDLNLTEDMICAAWLHDVLEMSKDRYTLYDLIAVYFSLNTLNYVDTLTHLKDVPYNIYICDMLDYPEAIVIKFADMIDNTTDIVIGTKQFEKYRKACQLLQKNKFEVPKILKERLQIP